MRRTFVWTGAPGSFRVEIAHVELENGRLRAEGTQIGVDEQAYELRYELEEPRLRVQVVGGARRDLELDAGRDHFDLGYSPLFNSLPVLRHGLHRGGEPRDFVMTWIDVPALTVAESRQRYEPVRGDGTVRYSSGDYSAEIVFDDAGFVLDYPGLATRVFPPATR